MSKILYWIIPLTTKVDPPKKAPFHFANAMRLTESSNSMKISCHTKFRDNFLIFKGIGIIRVKPTDAEKQGIKESQLQYCVQGHHSFKSLENEGLHSLLQTMVNIAAKHGRFDVKDLLYGRKTISEFSKLKAEELKQKLKIELTEPQKADS